MPHLIIVQSSPSFLAGIAEFRLQEMDSYGVEIQQLDHSNEEHDLKKSPVPATLLFGGGGQGPQIRAHVKSACIEIK